MDRRWRMFVAFGLLLFLFALLAVRLTYLMLFAPAEKIRSIDRIRHLFAVTEGRRGNIYDRHGVALAVTVPTVEVGVDPKLAPMEVREEALIRLAEILRRPVPELKNAVSG
ncbi:MAG: hypothetical protein LBF24_02495, partial [Puniceicoccales bacterium]|nr:hypothetical protein [Puniceicoccales bacterium]